MQPTSCVRFNVHAVAPAEKRLPALAGPWRAFPLARRGAATPTSHPLPPPPLPAVQNKAESLSSLDQDLKLPSSIKQVWATSCASGAGFVREAAAAVPAGGAAPASAGAAPAPSAAGGSLPAAPAHAEDDVVMHAASGVPSLLAVSVYEAFYKVRRLPPPRARCPATSPHSPAPRATRSTTPSS